jgi:hypothetical protein
MGFFAPRFARTHPLAKSRCPQHKNSLGGF